VVSRWMASGARAASRGVLYSFTPRESADAEAADSTNSFLWRDCSQEV
jgi:hypothetical protein